MHYYNSLVQFVDSYPTLDDAKFLQNNKRFASAIPLYIISYEELNKGLFLEDHLFSKEDISDAEYKAVFTNHSHLKKLKIQYEVKKKTIEEMDDAEFDNYENISNKIGSKWFFFHYLDKVLRLF